MIEYELFSGRPLPGSRSPEEERCYDFLDSLAICYTRADHPEAMSMEDLEGANRALGCEIAKNLFLTNRQQTDFYLLIMPGSKPFKTKYLSAQLGCSRLSFASGEQLERMLGVQSGSASLLGLLNDGDKKVSLVFDREIFEDKFFGCHPCKNTSSLAFSTEDMLKKILPALGREYAAVVLPWEV